MRRGEHHAPPCVRSAHLPRIQPTDRWVDYDVGAGLTVEGYLVKESYRRRWLELVDAAAQVFYRKGFGAASVQDVADEIGLLKGSVYHYIKTKEDLLFAVAEEAHTASMNLVEKLKALDVDPATELAAFVRAHIHLLVSERVKLTVYLHDFRSLTADHRTTVGERRREYSAYVTDLIERGKASGVFSTSVDAELAMLAVLGMVNWIYEWYRDDDPEFYEALIVGFTESALRSVGTDGGVIARVIDAGVAI